MSSQTLLHKQSARVLTLSAFGVVFGDIGTSPLYAIKQIFNSGLPMDQNHVLGVLSLIFWSLILVVTIKYTVFIMRADNKGEGGIMALLALAMFSAKDNPRRKLLIIQLGLLGAALFYGDSTITPAISVLSAVEGLEVMAPQLDRYILPITAVVLSMLFMVQQKGTHAVSKMFSPVMGIWFVVLAVLGLSNVVNEPVVLWAVNPAYGLKLLAELGWHGFLIMGSVVLVVTGAEALYADMGHFGPKPIRYAWFGLVLPALLCNYFGQGALLLKHPGAIQNPFYHLAPGWALYPLLVLSALATIIASQAVISGTFSMTRQAMQLGYCPRMTIHHTSGDERGQIYVPVINWLLMAGVFIVVVTFHSSTNLAFAYGLAVTGTMLITTLLAFIVIRALWEWKTFNSVLFLAIFLTVDLTFFSSNCLKIVSGGWLPLLIACVLYVVTTTWIKGRALLAEKMDEKRILFEELEERLKDQSLATVKGTAIYLTRILHGVPGVLLHNLAHNHVLHEKVIVLTIVTTDEPYVDETRRVKIRSFGKERKFYRVKLYFGFQQNQDVRRALELVVQQGLAMDPETVSFFVGSENIIFKRKSKMPKWRRPIFLFLLHNASSAIGFFKIPVERVVEIGVRVEL